MSRCRNHPAREAVARCPECGGMFCRECITEHDLRMMCAGCLAAEADRTSATRRSLISLGAVMTLVQMTFGLGFVWAVCYGTGRALIEIPDSFHDGALFEEVFQEAAGLR